uniref:Uncharacterized protein n=1 Tax=Anguilla anguilla TaxID=7936 RepID=A0A0E9TGL3_ANGAN
MRGLETWKWIDVCVCLKLQEVASGWGPGADLTVERKGSTLPQNSASCARRGSLQGCGGGS